MRAAGGSHASSLCVPVRARLPGLVMLSLNHERRTEQLLTCFVAHYLFDNGLASFVCYYFESLYLGGSF